MTYLKRMYLRMIYNGINDLEADYELCAQRHIQELVEGGHVFVKEVETGKPRVSKQGVKLKPITKKFLYLTEKGTTTLRS